MLSSDGAECAAILSAAILLAVNSGRGLELFIVTDSNTTGARPPVATETSESIATNTCLKYPSLKYIFLQNTKLTTHIEFNEVTPFEFSDRNANNEIHLNSMLTTNHVETLLVGIRSVPSILC